MPPPTRSVPVQAASPTAAPSHAEFLLNQTRQNVAQLSATGALDSMLCRQLESLLSTATIRAPELPARAESAVVPKSEKEKLSAKNKWTREVLANSDLLPNLVDAALSVAAGPLLSSSQRQSIVQVVSISQDRIANAITDPSRQRSAQSFTTSSAKAAHQGIKSGLQKSGESFDRWSKKREMTAEEKRTEKLAQQAFQEELKRERDMFADGRKPSVSDSIGSAQTSLSSMNLKDAHGAEGISLAPDNPASASVVALPSEHVSMDSQTGAVTTTFTPWPGLVLTSTIVATTGESDEASGGGLDTGRALPPPPPTSGSAPPPPMPPSGPNFPPPPPRHAPPPPQQSFAPPPVHGHAPQAAPPMHQGAVQGQVPSMSYMNPPPY